MDVSAFHWGHLQVLLTKCNYIQVEWSPEMSPNCYLKYIVRTKRRGCLRRISNFFV